MKTNQYITIMLVGLLSLDCSFGVATPAPTPPTQSPQSFADMILIPAGEFTMGSETGEADEKPVHTVYLNDYTIDKYETTNAQYAECVNAGKCTEPNDKSSSTRASYYGNAEFANYPVIYVDWTQAKAYCEFAGKRLPTEAEWEKAARGTDGRTWPWGNNEPNDTLLNYNGKVGNTTVVGSYPSGASSYGVMDMAGNVWEWTSSEYKTYPYKVNDGRENNEISANNDKILRGGGWDSNGSDTRVTYRVTLRTTFWSAGIGSRCVR